MVSWLRPAQRQKWQQLARRLRVPLGFLLAAAYLVLARPSWASLAAGGSVALSGLALRAYAAGYIRKDRELATGGPYRFIRNPLYLGSVLLGAGFAIAGRRAIVVLAMGVLFLAAYWPVIRAEEEFLENHFPAFHEYAGQVPRLIPRWRPLGVVEGLEPARFSFELYRSNREYNSLLGSLLLLAALIGKLMLRL